MTHEERKHTPAPWHHSPELSRTGCELVYAGDKHLVANVGSFGRSDETNRANAWLVAAAPELLEACETALHELRIRCGYKGQEAAYVELSAALAKATGRAA